VTRLRLRISGIATVEEARVAVGIGADAIGLDPAALPAGPPADETLAAIALALPPAVTPILVTRALTAGAIAQQVDAAAALAVEIARPLPSSEYPGLKRIIRGRKIIQSVPLGDADAEAFAASCIGFADALLLAPADANEARLCRRIAEGCGLPVFLRAHAAAEAMIRDIRPFALDIAAPRRHGRLDATALAALCGRPERPQDR